MVPHYWVRETLKVVGVADNVRQFLDQSMRNWKTVLRSNGDTLGEVSIKRGIFQWDSLSPLVFTIILIPFFMTFNSTKYGYLLLKETTMNDLLFMDDLNLYVKTESELKSLVHTDRIVSNDIAVEFGMDKFSTMHIKKVKICDMEDIEIPDGQPMKQIEESGYKYLGIIQDNEIKTQVMKDKIRTEYLWRVRNLAKSEL